jgi:polysaccharide export outer membrane protein/exopolysaccharide production protein ExoF
LTLLCLPLDARAQSAGPSTLATPGQAGDADYVLGPLDKVRLKVFAWRPSRDEVFEWKALNDVYTVGASGQVSLPLIGDVAASGRSLRELCQAVSAGLKETLGLVEAPSATAEIAEFRPFYILGAVQRPGEYSYRPRLTIIQAISLAGGLQRLSELEAIRLERETISTMGDTQIIENEINSLLAKRARLQAESAGANYIEFPLALIRASGGDALDSLRQQEQNIFNARRGAYELRAKELERMRAGLQKEIRSNEDTLEAQTPYMDVASQEFKQFDELYTKKLVTLNRVAEAARNVIQVQAERLRMDIGLSRVRQDISRIDMELLDLRNARVNQAITEFRTTQARLDELERRHATAEALLLEAPVSSARLVSTGDQSLRSRISYTITRPAGGTAIDIAATETTLVQPGDTVRVEVPQRDEALRSVTAANDGVAARPTALRSRIPMDPTLASGAQLTAKRGRDSQSP